MEKASGKTIGDIIIATCRFGRFGLHPLQVSFTAPNLSVECHACHTVLAIVSKLSSPLHSTAVA